MKEQPDGSEEKGLSFWLGVAASLASFVALALAIAEQYGVTLPGILPNIMSSGIFWLPPLFGVTGFVIGWNVRNSSAHKEADSVREKLGMTIEEAVTRLDAQKAEDQALLDKMNDLPADYKWLLAWLYVEGRIDGSYRSDFSVLLDSAVEPGEIEEQELFYAVVAIYEQPDGSDFFELKPRTRRLIDGDEKILPQFIEEVKSGGLEEHIAFLKELEADKERRRMMNHLSEPQQPFWERPPHEIG